MRWYILARKYTYIYTFICIIHVYVAVSATIVHGAIPCRLIDSGPFLWKTDETFEAPESKREFTRMDTTYALAPTRWKKMYETSDFTKTVLIPTVTRERQCWRGSQKPCTNDSLWNPMYEYKTDNNTFTEGQRIRTKPRLLSTRRTTFRAAATKYSDQDECSLTNCKL